MKSQKSIQNMKIFNKIIMNQMNQSEISQKSKEKNKFTNQMKRNAKVKDRKNLTSRSTVST